MRSLEGAESSWPLLQTHSSLVGLRNSVLNDSDEPSISLDLRSACWKAFLLCETVEFKSWPQKLQSSREAYTSLKGHFLRGFEHPEELDSSGDPLTDSFDSPWIRIRQDETIRAEILQDVERCMPEHLYFRQPVAQNILLDVLFIWSKLNPDVGYRQGMHEVLAPILWAVERDAIDPSSAGLDDDPKTERNLTKMVFDATYIAHDTFALFTVVMRGLRSAYEQGHTASSGKTLRSRLGGEESPMISRSKRIVNDYLSRTDPQLAQHLQDIEIIPQTFLLRWLRLLFGREFHFDQLLSMWDNLFACDPALESIDLICVAMLLRIRWQLVEADYNTAITLLLRFPALPEAHPPSTLVLDALYLKTHLNTDGGDYLISKYSGRSPQRKSRPNAAWSPTRQSIARPSDLARSALAASSRQLPVGSLEALLQDAARGVYQRGERWGVNKAVRDAVGEVRKNVQSLSRTHSRTGSLATSEGAGSSPAELMHRIDSLRARNKALAKMLEDAASDLWQTRLGSADVNSQDDEQGESFATAVAKIQLVQVYLADESLQLPSDESDPSETKASEEPASTEAVKEVPNPATVAPAPVKSPQKRPSASDSNASGTAGEAPTVPRIEEPSSNEAAPASKPSRPSLEQSSFSWMLGQESSSQTAARQSSGPGPFRDAGERRRTNNRTAAAYLFGDPEDVSADGKPDPSSSKPVGGERDADGSQQSVFAMRSIEQRGKS